MNFLSLIEAKRDGKRLEAEQIRQAIISCAAGEIPDYQIAAFLMAVCCRGLAAEETKALTLAMRDSGDVLTFPPDPRPLVDKHSTGGVGDKVSLPLTPLLACLGFRVPMISGRGLGITGGTLDKLESIPGFQTALSRERIIEIVQSVGCVICGQTESMVPADKRLYALRDATGTVPSIPLIVASILSKKLAEGLQALVLDVKFGTAAFMPTLDKARALAKAMVSLANECGVNTCALLTRMDVPLGRAAGNWLEVVEAVESLDPHAAAPLADLRELVVTCAALLLLRTGKSKKVALARKAAERCLASGEPRKKWDEMLLAQGADLDAFHQKLKNHARAAAILELKAPDAGYISRCDARIIGETIRDLGGGRHRQDSAVDHDIGLDQIVKPGEAVRKGSVLARVHARNTAQAEAAAARIRSAFLVDVEPFVPPALIARIIE